ncbi:multicopper oxidase [Paenibacillus sp. N1-5-1-14]|uniref:multicopper oxidase family protein n=1 Tax=Paenibacillus radicibacter TaxID=2972488 RepID=UPI0021591FEA|nr:multicopper oxidase [Paenibacillus radicibacter]MCR8644623.1 multicopper oxidase [Paenibacillus radicibacter]
MPLAQFVDPLPIPKTIRPFSRKDGVSHYRVRMKQFKYSLHRDLPATTLWGYNGQFPGPTFEVQRGEEVKVLWESDLPRKHLLPVDTTVHGAEKRFPRVRNVVHLHGARVRANSDGYPESWFTRGFKHTGPTYTQKVYTYPNRQRATTLWYHDHAIGITRLNVYAGLAGFYLIRDKAEACLHLPKGRYEIPLMIADRTLNSDGSLYYPSEPLPGMHHATPTPTKRNLPDPSVVPEYFAESIVVNGKVWPYLNVEPRKYRFRILNASNDRFYNIKLSSGQSFYQIGTDGGLLEKPVKLKQLLIAPAERADIIIDFSKFKGKSIIMTNNAEAPYPMGVSTNLNPATTGRIMQFRVNQPLKCPDKSQIPARLSFIPKLTRANVAKVRQLSLDETVDQYGRLLLLLNNQHWDMPVTEKPVLGTKEIWNLVNTTTDTHPIHLHLVHFQILQFRPFDVEYYTRTKKIRFTGPPTKPDANDRGWKDTVKAKPGQVTQIIARFGPYTGQYVWHCHMLEHEDHDMMRPYRVVKRKKP